MQCSRCRHENSDGAKFCGECGTRLELACPACATLNPPANKFCQQCGGTMAAADVRFASPDTYTPSHLARKILTARTSLAGERKTVTVLFADLKGSLELLVDRDPEDARALLDAVIERLMEAVHRFEGTVNQVMGDGIMALFGAPVAHEDHAVRACYAALRMQRAVAQYAEEVRRRQGLDVQIRVGINSGEVVVRSVGSDLNVEYTAVGQTTHLAARMEQLARPGTSMITEATRRLADRHIEVESRGPVPIKGMRQPVEVWELCGAAPASRLQSSANALTRFLGREDELVRLEALLDRVTERQGQVVAIVGEAGVGKSRLLAEFRRRLAGRSVTWLEGHCVPYGHAMPYLPVLEMLRQHCGLAEDDRPEIVAVKLRACLREAGLDPDEDAPHLLPLLGLADATSGRARAPEAMQARSFELLRRLMLGSRHRPLVMVVEDLHWVDAISEDYAASLVERVGAAPMLLVFSYRPGYRPRWIDRSSGTQLALTPLGPAESRAIVRASALPAEATERILDRAEGNPLFLEELARAAAGAGGRGPDVPLPDTVHDVLSARVDHLPETARRVLQCAAVLGRQFSARLLRAVWDGSEGHLDEHLRELGRLEFLEERFGAGEPTFVFKHALVQDVIYGSLLERQRRAVHGRAARALEGFHAGRLDAVVEPLAHHFARGDDPERAAEYARLAAPRAPHFLAPS